MFTRPHLSLVQNLPKVSSLKQNTKGFSMTFQAPHDVATFSNLPFHFSLPHFNSRRSALAQAQYTPFQDTWNYSSSALDEVSSPPSGLGPNASFSGKTSSTTPKCSCPGPCACTHTPDLSSFLFLHCTWSQLMCYVFYLTVYCLLSQ